MGDWSQILAVVLITINVVICQILRYFLEQTQEKLISNTISSTIFFTCAPHSKRISSKKEKFISYCFHGEMFSFACGYFVLHFRVRFFYCTSEVQQNLRVFTCSFGVFILLRSESSSRLFSGTNQKKSVSASGKSLYLEPNLYCPWVTFQEHS